MHRSNISFLSLLFLTFLLLSGTFQTRTVYACAMMDMAMHDQCCCDDHGNCAASDCGDALIPNDSPCCERSVELTNNLDIQQAVPLSGQRVEISSDVDPPEATFITDDFLSVTRVFTSPIIFPATISAARSGSDTYLITQRLRI
jgi:hypothetical protein